MNTNTFNFNFIGNRKKAFIFSGALFVITFISLLINGGPRLSIDFTGGTSLIIPYLGEDVANDVSEIRNSIAAMDLGSFEVRTFSDQGLDYVQIDINSEKLEGVDLRNAVVAEMTKLYPELQGNREISSESIGPKVGRELAGSTVWAIILSLLGIVIYVGIRFRFAYGLAAIGALFHDVVITFGFFSVLGWEISLPIVAAILTIVGYSLNDTIVVFDRIRENLREKDDKSLSLADKVNRSLNETLSRTIITSVTTFAVVAVMFGFFFTSTNVLKYFSAALIVGIISGTYSSLFIASNILISLDKKWSIK